ncbi:hypothetical protein F0A17_15785 [Billgrantia pellis]|uniref:Uncharacterized protein n=1 Tax=Billgrantia pellis TaxID=2606936 RepID=A0A7V7FXG1_9GAMM|nr:hypothetical protein [Halomonas pellis]KAA0010680.1 hypothetical protein F0A17_15785 [Halomonas pellis]
MIRFTSLLLIAWLGMNAIAAGDNAKSRGVMPVEKNSNQIEILFDGEPGTRFVATLTIHRDGEIETHELEEAVPSQYRYQGEALEASVRQTSPEGGLTVEVRKGGNVSRSSSSGEHSRLRLQVR